MIIRDWCSTAAPPFFMWHFFFLASRASEDEFPRNDDEDRNDEESDKDSFDVETR